MIRISKHILKFQTKSKTVFLDQLFNDYYVDLQFYINLIWNQTLPLKNNLSSKNLPANKLQHSQYKQILYKQASEIIRSNKKKKKTKKPVIKNVTINIDQRLFNIQKSDKEFDEFIHLRLPYFQCLSTESQSNKKLAEYIRLPTKWHKQSLKYSDWDRADTIQLKKSNGYYFICFIYKKEKVNKRKKGKSIGIDQGYKKLMVTSDGQFIGRSLERLYKKISNKKQGSNNFRQSLIERDDRINEEINKMNFDGIKEIVIEDLKNVKKNTKKKINKEFNNKLQRWVYTKVVRKFERFCEENGILLIKVNPAYTSQICSKCGFRHENNRNGVLFKCLSCGMEMDADLNASINILHRGVYNPSNSKNLKC